MGHCQGPPVSANLRVVFGSPGVPSPVTRHVAVTGMYVIGIKARYIRLN